MEIINASDCNVVMRLADTDDLPQLDSVRQAAFAPIFASFCSIVGKEIYELAIAADHNAQGELLASSLETEADCQVYAAEVDAAVIGFISSQLHQDRKVGEIGLNAVHPAYAGRGIGTAMYDFAIAKMKAAGMKVATVGTGGDHSHAPARRAYAKSGFTKQLPSVWLYQKL